MKKKFLAGAFGLFVILSICLSLTPFLVQSAAAGGNQCLEVYKGECPWHYGDTAWYYDRDGSGCCCKYDEWHNPITQCI